MTVKGSGTRLAGLLAALEAHAPMAFVHADRMLAASVPRREEACSLIDVGSAGPKAREILDDRRAVETEGRHARRLIVATPREVDVVVGAALDCDGLRMSSYIVPIGGRRVHQRGRRSVGAGRWGRRRRIRRRRLRRSWSRRNRCGSRGRRRVGARGARGRRRRGSSRRAARRGNNRRRGGRRRADARRESGAYGRRRSGSLRRGSGASGGRRRGRFGLRRVVAFGQRRRNPIVRDNADGKEGYARRRSQQEDEDKFQHRAPAPSEFRLARSGRRVTQGIWQAAAASGASYLNCARCSIDRRRACPRRRE